MGSLLIVNPFASGVDEHRVEAVRAELDWPELAFTERRGHATELAREREASVDALYVFSGDGGFNEVLNGVTGRVPVGLVPGGGASVLARALGLPHSPVDAARRLARGHRRRISLGRANGRRFGFSAGLGLDAEFVRRVDALGRRPDGKRAGNVRFALTALQTVWESKGRIEPELEIEGHGEAAFALVANCDPYTFLGPVALHVAPLARFELGLDVVAPRRVTPALVPRLGAYLARGRGQERSDDVLYLHDADRVEIRCRRPLPLHVDGEDLGDVEHVLLEAERDAVEVLV